MLANALKKNNALRELHIKGNELGNEGVKAICTALSERETPFEDLDVGNNRCEMDRAVNIVYLSLLHCPMNSKSSFKMISAMYMNEELPCL